MRAVLLFALFASAWAANYDVLCATHVVASGDSLWSISDKYGVQQDELVSALEACLPGWSSSTPLQVGQKICLPGWIPACEFVTDSGNVAGCKAYKIQQGDTMALIAAVFGIYAQDLSELNSDLASTSLQPGRFLRLPPWASTCPDPDADAPSCRVYSVQSGDFVFGIASVFRVAMEDLLAVNPGMQTNTLLQAGMRVKIPPFPSTCGNGIMATPPTTGVFSCRVYKVKLGDSLASIALKFETTVNSLVSTNPELNDPALLQPGRIVRIAPYPADCINGILIDTGITLKLTLTSTNVSAVMARSTTIASSLASLLSVPASWISLSATSTSRRRLQAAGDVSLAITVLTATQSALAANAQSAEASIRSLLASAGLTAAPGTLSVTPYPTTTTTASPSPSPAASAPAPSPTPVTASSASSGGSNVGAIVGGVVGGVGGALAVAGIAWFILRKRREGSAAAPPRSAYAGAGVTATLTGAIPSVKTRAANLKDDQGVSSSPRNTVTPRTRVGQLA